MFGKKKPQSLRLKEETNLHSHTSTLESTKEEIDHARMLGLNAVERIDSLEKNLIAEQNKHAKINQHIADLRKELATAEEECSSIENNQRSIQVETLTAQTEKQEIGVEFNQLLDAYKKESEDYGSSIQSIEKKLGSFANGVGADRSYAKFGTPLRIKKAVAVGDLHGWAPGLIHSIQSNNIGQVHILNRPISEDRMSILFPNPVQLHALGLPLPCVGLNGHPLRPNARPTMFDGLWVDMTPSGSQTTLIQLGDVIDRGDHSELSFELLRSMLIQQPCSSLTLLGNHEVWILEGDLDGWMLNEERYRMTDGKPGSVIHDPLITGLADLNSSMKNSFSVLEGALGAFLLTQHFSFRLGLSAPQRSNFDAIFVSSLECLKIRKLETKVLKGGWDLHQIGRQALECWRNAAQHQPTVIPGGFSLVSLVGNTFGHAEPSSFQHSQTDLKSLHSVWNWGGQPLRFVPTVLDCNGIQNAPLFHSRTTEKGGAQWHDEIAISLLELLQHAPETVRYCHGHTVIKAPDVRQIEVDGRRLEIVNCDLGMTPFYRHLRHGDAYQSSTQPYQLILEFEQQPSDGEE